MQWLQCCHWHLVLFLPRHQKSCAKKKKETVKPLKLRHIENSVADISFVEDIHEEQVPAQYTTLSS
jgi:hypothetical protein